MTQDQANALVINADENVLQGWLDLQRMWFDNRNDPTLLKAGVKDWQTRYPQNPGAKMLPTALVNMQTISRLPPTRLRSAAARPGRGLRPHHPAGL
jgi:outer membrane PBP1 activator LpoA protein